MRTVTKNVRKAIGIIMAITFVVASLVIPSTTVQAKTKKAAVTTPGVILVLNDGTQVAWSKGITIPLSKLTGSYIVMTNAAPGMSYAYAQFIGVGDYYIEDDPEVNWAYEGVLTQTDNEAVLAEYGAYVHPEEDIAIQFKILPTATPIAVWGSAEGFAAEPAYDTYTMFYQEVDANATETANHWSFNFKIDRTK